LFKSTTTKSSFKTTKLKGGGEVFTQVLVHVFHGTELFFFFFSLSSITTVFGWNH